MAGMRQFRKFTRGWLDAIADEVADFAKTALKTSKGGAAFHVTVQGRQGLQGDVTRDAQDNYDIEIRATPVGPIGEVIEIGADAGFGRESTSSFIGAGNLELTIGIKLVNAQALAAGVDADITP